MAESAQRFIGAVTAIEAGLSPYDAVGVAEMSRLDLVAYAAFVTGAYSALLRDVCGDDLPTILQRYALEAAS